MIVYAGDEDERDKTWITFSYCYRGTPSPKWPLLYSLFLFFLSTQVLLFLFGKLSRWRRKQLFCV